MKRKFFINKLNPPIVVDVMEARRPKIQEKGREMAIAPDFIFETWANNDFRNNEKLEREEGKQFQIAKLTSSCSRKQK